MTILAVVGLVLYGLLLYLVGVRHGRASVTVKPGRVEGVVYVNDWLAQRRARR